MRANRDAVCGGLRRLHRAPPLLLDNLKGPAAAKRISVDEDGWYFQAREGRMGPYGSRGEAERQLMRHVLLMQSAADGPRPPRELSRAGQLPRIRAPHFAR